MTRDIQYVDSEERNKLPEEFISRWDEWIGEQRDAGLIDAYKDKSTNPPTWRCDVFLPDHLYDEYKRLTTSD